MIEEVMMVAGVLAEVVVVKVVSVVMIKVMVMEVLEVPGGGGVGTHKFRLPVCRPQTLTVFKDEAKAGWMICMKFSTRGSTSSSFLFMSAHWCGMRERSIKKIKLQI